MQQQQIQQQQQQQATMQSRPPFLSSNTAPLPGAGLPLRSTDMVTGQSIHSLFEQLQQASLEGPSTSSETSSIRERATPPSASESDIAHQQQFQELNQLQQPMHGKAASAEEARRQAGKQASHDGVAHKRRSHATRTGKNSALERLPSVHGHLHHVPGHGHAHASAQSRPQSQSSSQHHSPAGGAVPVQSDARLSPLSHAEAAQPDVLAWLNPQLSRSAWVRLRWTSMIRELPHRDNQRGLLTAQAPATSLAASMLQVLAASLVISRPSLARELASQAVQVLHHHLILVQAAR